MAELAPTLITAGVGVVLLALVLLRTLAHLRRFSLAADALRRGVAERTRTLQEIADARRRAPG